MKRVVLLSAILAILSIGVVNSQNLMINGDLESWTGGDPDGWTKAENITQESTIIHGGSYSAKHTSDEGTKDFQQDVTAVQAGQEYTISYWFLDNDSEARTRMWSYWLSGGSTLQIAETSQINIADKEQYAIMKESTHFNPVDLVCGTKNYRGEKFDLLKFRNPETGFISEKSKDGKNLKAQELPGLWNGAMANWITIFVEVPLITFNPVKTVNDLLRDEHQGE